MPEVSKTKELLIITGIFLLALSARSIYLYESSANPSFSAPVVDSGVYDTLARNTAQGKGINYEFFWQPFFYPAFLSVVYTISGSSILLAKIVQILLGCLTCVLTYILGKKVFGRQAGVIAAIITALYAPLIFFETELLASGWAAFFSVTLILIILHTSLKKNTWLFCVLGITAGLSFITRPTFFLFLAASALFLAISLFRSEKTKSRTFFKLTLGLLSFFIIVLPVALLGLKISDHFAILPASGGVNFYVGNNPDINQTLAARPGWGWEEITSLPEENGFVGNMWVQQEYYKEQNLSFIQTQPAAFAKNLLQKTLHFLCPRELPRNIDIYVFRKWSKLLSILVWKYGGFGFPLGILLPLGLFGLIFKWRKIPVPLKLFIVLYPVSIIIIFASARYRIPVIPVLAVLAGQGILSLISLIKNKKRLLAVVICTCGTAITLFLSFQGPFVQEQGDFEAELYANAASTLLMQGNSEKTIEYLQKALSLKNDYPFAHANLGAELIKLERFHEAIPHLQNALEFKEDSHEVHNNMASAFAGIGKIEQAKTSFQRAIDIKPNYAQAYYNMGNMLLKHGELSGAISYLEQAIKYKQDYAKAYSDLGIVHTSNGQVDKGILYFAKAVMIEPEDTSFRANLTTALSILENAQEIVDEYCQSTDLEKSLTLIRLACSLENLKNTDFKNPKYMIFAQKAFELTDITMDETANTPQEIYSSALVSAEKGVELSGSIKQAELVPVFKKQAIYFKSRLMENKKTVP